MCSRYEIKRWGKSLARAILNDNINLLSTGKMKSYVKVVTPSTIANFGPGFDVFGLAHDGFQDTIKIKIIEKEGIDINITGTDSEHIPREPDNNSAGYVAKYFSNKLPKGYGFKIDIEKGIPVGKGLGSSGASAAGCIVGLNRLLDLELSNNQLVSYAAKGESVSAGIDHADNVAASILGGFTIIRSYNPLHVMSLTPPTNMAIALAIPKLPIVRNKTEKARKILPDDVPIKSFVHNVGHASTVVAGISLGDVEMMGQGMSDAIVEPVRSRLIPGYDSVRKKALYSGASGVAISGAGQTIIAIVDENKVSALEVAESMKEAFEKEGVSSDIIASKPSKGAKIIEEV